MSHSLKISESGHKIENPSDESNGKKIAMKKKTSLRVRKRRSNI